MRKHIENRFERINVFRVFQKSIKVVVALEIALLVGSYFAWKSLNNSQDLRYKLYKFSPKILEGHYKIGDMYGSDMRQRDKEAWQIK